MAETAQPDTGAGGTGAISRRGAPEPHPSRAGRARSGARMGAVEPMHQSSRIAPSDPANTRHPQPV